MQPRTKRLRLRQLDARLRRWRALPQVEPPASGWIKTIREALGMSAAHLARRLGVAKKNVVALEQREARGAVRLDSLARAAHALDCELVYAVVPRESLQAMRERRARGLARARLGRVAHSMALENQSVSARERAIQEREAAEELLRAWPRGFWDDSE